MMEAQHRIRVLFPYADGEAIGGSHTSSLTLAAGLDRSQFEPIILLHGQPGALGQHVEGLGLDVMRMERPAVLAGRLKRSRETATLPGYFLRALPSLIAFLRREQIDIVHTNEGGMHASWSLPSKLAGTKHVWHHRQPPDVRGANFLAPLLADRILSVSHFSRPARPIRDISDRFEVVRSPFDLPAELPDRGKCREALLREISAPPEAALLGYFGALSTRKRPDHFVRVVAKVREAMPERAVHGLIFGKEEVAGSGMDAACRDLADELGLAGHLHMMGHRSPVEALIAAIDVHAVTALNEPFGRTLIEAMQLETPVVATRHGGNTEAIIDGETGFLVDPDLPSAFVPSILRLLGDPIEHRRITENAKRFARGLTTEAHVAQVSAIYRQLANASGSTGRSPAVPMSERHDAR